MNVINAKNSKKQNISMTKIYFNNDGDVVLEDYNQGKRIIYKKYQMQIEEKIEIKDNKNNV